MLNDKPIAFENMEEIQIKIKGNVATYFEDKPTADMVYKFAMRLNMLIEVKKTKQKTSQTKISKAIGIGKSTLSEYACGKKFPKLDILLKLSDYFGVSLDYLLGRSETKISYNDELNKRFGFTDNAIDTLEVVHMKEYLNVMFDNDRDAINYLLEEIKSYEDDLNSLDKLDKNSENYAVERVWNKRNLKQTKFRLQEAFMDLIDNYYKK